MPLFLQVTLNCPPNLLLTSGGFARAGAQPKLEREQKIPIRTKHHTNLHPRSRETARCVRVLSSEYAGFKYLNPLTSVNQHHSQYKYNDFFSIIQKKRKNSFLDIVQSVKFPANLSVYLVAKLSKRTECLTVLRSQCQTTNEKTLLSNVRTMKVPA